MEKLEGGAPKAGIGRSRQFGERVISTLLESGQRLEAQGKRHHDATRLCAQQIPQASRPPPAALWLLGRGLTALDACRRRSPELGRTVGA